MDDPTQMSDEELNAKITGAQPEETPTKQETPVAPPEEETPAGPEITEPTPAEPEPEETPAPSRREQLRVQTLLKKYGPPPEAPAQPPVPSQDPSAPDFRQIVSTEDPELYETLDKTAADYGQSQYARGISDSDKKIRAVEWRTLLHIDAPAMEAKYKVLDQSDKENFHPALADAMSRRYMQMIGFDPSTGAPERPDIRWRDFVESEFELAEEIASAKTTASSANIAKQAAQTGLRPDGSAARGMDLSKHPSEMTVEELNAAIGAAPRDARGRFTAR